MVTWLLESIFCEAIKWILLQMKKASEKREEQTGGKGKNATDLHFKALYVKQRFTSLYYGIMCHQCIC